MKINELIKELDEYQKTAIAIIIAITFLAITTISYQLSKGNIASILGLPLILILNFTIWLTFSDLFVNKSY